MNKEVLINGIIKRLKENCELRPSEILVLINHIEDLQQRIDDAIERLNALIVFWKKYNPIDNTMQVEQFKGVIDILGGKE